MNTLRCPRFENGIRRILLKCLDKLSFLLPNKHFPIRYSGGIIYLNLKESGRMRQRALGLYEEWKTRLFSEIVKEGMIIIDAGANKGYFSFLSARLMNDKGRVLSFEPYPENCFWIKKSIKANNYNCIKLYQCALSDKEGFATFYPGKKSGHGSLIFLPGTAEPEKKPLKVKTRKLDNILKEEGIDDVDIVKIDVEAADLLVLRGAENFLKKSKKVKLVMDVDVQDSKEKKELFELLHSCGLQIYKIDRKLIHVKEADELIQEMNSMKGLSDKRGIYAVKRRSH